MKVHDVYRQHIATCAPTATLRAAAHHMEQFDSGIVVVVSSGLVDAVITERDVVRAVARGADPQSPVMKYATRDVLTAKLDEETSQIARRMIEGDVRRLPVVDDGERLLGVVSMRDLFIVETLMPSETTDDDVCIATAASLKTST